MMYGEGNLHAEVEHITTTKSAIIHSWQLHLIVLWFDMTGDTTDR